MSRPLGALLVLAGLWLSGCTAGSEDVVGLGNECGRIDPVASWVTSIAWDPGGTRLAVFSSRGVDGEASPGLYLVDASGDSVEKVLDQSELGASAVWLDWSPTGENLAMWRSGVIWVYHLETRMWRQVTEATVYSDAPRWSPDGEWVYYVRSPEPPEPPSAGGLFLTDLRTGWTRPVVSLDGGLVWPIGPISFSPDGEWITYVAGLPGPEPEASTSVEVFKIRRDGRARTQLTFLGGQAGDAQWLPDGSEIVFNFAPTRCAESGYVARHTWGVRPDGSRVHQWSHDLGDTRVPEGIRPAIAPDGRRVAFAGVGDRVHVGVLCTMPITGGRRNQLFPR